MVVGAGGRRAVRRISESNDVFDNSDDDDDDDNVEEDKDEVVGGGRRRPLSQHSRNAASQ